MHYPWYYNPPAPFVPPFSTYPRPTPPYANWQHSSPSYPWSPYSWSPYSATWPQAYPTTPGYWPTSAAPYTPAPPIPATPRSYHKSSVLPYSCDMEFSWDVNNHPSSVRQVTLWTPYFQERQVLKVGEMVWPRANAIQVKIPDLPEYWASVSISNKHGVKVPDIIKGIYDHLQTPLLQSEWDYAIPAYFGKKWYEAESKIRHAYTERCRNAHGLFHYELNQGLRRVDVLMGATKFKRLQLDHGLVGTLHRK
ncbi:hypothetical protein BD410DRAFT_785293 [Rickenella mellea]|uniref:DUF6699 domain-containing protein n=1 Tax=Rickenella mellea TaxID=50990 RepID=A0A4Y7QDM0_9AGAM|nr:hypothetical protein BD410DRAFT_785293 [Rickenella mellea]